MQRSFLDLKVPPVVVVIIAAACMCSVAVLLPAWTYSSPYRVWIALLVFALGVAVLVSGLIAFSQAQTTVNPHQPFEARLVVDSGVFGITRNPACGA